MRQSLHESALQARCRDLGTFIRVRRQELGLTQTELASRCGWSQERISLLETGRYGLPSIYGLATLADGLGIALADVIEASGFQLGQGRRNTGEAFQEDRATA